MLDARQAALGEQLAAKPPQWALERVGRSPGAEPAPSCGPTGKQRAGDRRVLPGGCRASRTPAQAIGPVPAGTAATLREAFHASVRALQLPDEAALLKAMGQGELEAAVDEHDRALALAPADVQAEIDQRAAEWEDAQVRAHIAGGTQDAEAQAEAETRGPGRRRGPGPARRGRRGTAGVDRGSRRASGPGRGGRARAPFPRPGRADPGHRRRGGRRFGGAARDARDRPGRVGTVEGRAGRPGRGRAAGPGRGLGAA